MDSPLGHEVFQFFRTYSAALGDYDAAACAALWGEPGTILTDDFAGSLATRAEIESALAQGFPVYQQVGATSAEFTIQHTEQVTARIVRVQVGWNYMRGDESLVETQYEYVLRADDDGLHAYVAISIDEQQKLAGLTDPADR